MKIMGIDEAGRGCVIGPLVLGAVLIEEKEEKALIAIGVKDSKQLSPKKRDDMFKKIEKVSLKTEVQCIAPDIIDTYCNKKLLNLLEAETAVALIHSLKPDKVYIDAPGKNGTTFLKQITKTLKHKCELICENKADQNYPVVSAASIMAKVTRDSEIIKLHQDFSPFGSGYPSDPKTRNFLKTYYKNNKKFPLCARHSWQTLEKIKGELSSAT